MNNQQVTPQQNINYSQFGDYAQSAQKAIQGGASLQDVQNAYNNIQAQQPKGNWFERALPTIGGIGGGILGSLVSPILGSAAGAGIGSSLGQELENKLTGTKGSTLGAGLESAAGGLVGGVAGKGISLVGGLLGKGADIGAVQSLGAQFGNKLDKNVLQDLYTNHEITNTDTFQKLANIYTGAATEKPGQALLNNVVEKTVKDPNLLPVDISSLKIGSNAVKGTPLQGLEGETSGNYLENILTKNGMSQGNDRASVIQEVNNSLGKAKPNINDEISRGDLLQFQKDMAKNASIHTENYVKSGYTNSSEQKLANAYNELDNAARSATFTDSISPATSNKFEDIAAYHQNNPNADYLQISPEDTEKLASDVEKYASPISTKSAKTMADSIRSTNGDVMKIRALQNNWVEGSKALTKIQNAANMNYGTSIGNLAKASYPLVAATAGAGGKPGVIGAVLGKIAQNPQAEKLGTGILSNISKNLSSKGVQQILPRATAALGAGVGTIPALAGSVTPAQSQNNLTGATNMQGQQAGMGGAQPQSTLQNILNTYMGIGLTDPYLLSSTSPVVQALAPQVQKQQQAAALLGGLGQAYGQAGGAQGLGGGLISQATGIIPGTAANVYGRQQQATASALANLLGISPQAALSLTPQLTATPQAAQAPLGVLTNLVNSLQ